MKFSIKNFFSKWDEIRKNLRIWSHLLKKSFMENFIFCAVLQSDIKKTEKVSGLRINQLSFTQNLSLKYAVSIYWLVYTENVQQKTFNGNKVFIISFPVTIQQRILVLILFLFSHSLLLQSAPTKMFTRVLVTSLPFVFTFYRGFYIEGFHRSTLRESERKGLF